MLLQQGDVLSVIHQKEDGTMDVFVKDSKNEETYRGNDASTMQFSLTIPKTDVDEFIVQGRKVKGRVHFRIVE